MHKFRQIWNEVHWQTVTTLHGISLFQSRCTSMRNYLRRKSILWLSWWVRTIYGIFDIFFFTFFDVLKIQIYFSIDFSIDFYIDFWRHSQNFEWLSCIELSVFTRFVDQKSIFVSFFICFFFFFQHLNKNSIFEFEHFHPLWILTWIHQKSIFHKKKKKKSFFEFNQIQFVIRIFSWI